MSKSGQKTGTLTASKADLFPGLLIPSSVFSAFSVANPSLARPAAQSALFGVNITEAARGDMA